jgi:hypothetical protein
MSGLSLPTFTLGVQKPGEPRLLHGGMINSPAVPCGQHPRNVGLPDPAVPPAVGTPSGGKWLWLAQSCEPARARSRAGPAAAPPADRG